jgi:DNA-binding transcriptional regulator YdaS (Cro superfamily)
MTGMTLDQWLTEHNVSSQEFGRRVDVTGEAVRRWRSGERMPEPEMVETINSETNGQVSIADLHEMRLAFLRAPQKSTEAA